jgi:hypothetical protein
LAGLALLALTPPALANDDQLVYSERLNNGWQNWGYNSTLNFTNSTPVHSGGNSISATMPAWSKIWFVHDPMNTWLYTNFTFWANGGASGGQLLQVAHGSISGRFRPTLGNSSPFPSAPWGWPTART